MMRFGMAEIDELSVEKTLETLRGSDQPKSKNARLDALFRRAGDPEIAGPIGV
jgi:hypothetical protein